MALLRNTSGIPTIFGTRCFPVSCILRVEYCSPGTALYPACCCLSCFFFLFLTLSDPLKTFRSGEITRGPTSTGMTSLACSCRRRTTGSLFDPSRCGPLNPICTPSPCPRRRARSPPPVPPLPLFLSPFHCWAQEYRPYSPIYPYRYFGDCVFIWNVLCVCFPVGVHVHVHVDQERSREWTL